jgi:hypothetical protein
MTCKNSQERGHTTTQQQGSNCNKQQLIQLEAQPPPPLFQGDTFKKGTPM